jgi:hypothetical protein
MKESLQDAHKMWFSSREVQDPFKTLHIYYLLID